MRDGMTRALTLKYLPCDAKKKALEYSKKALESFSEKWTGLTVQYFHRVSKERWKAIIIAASMGSRVGEKLRKIK